MKAEKIISWFLPKEVRYNKTHPQYHELYTLIGSTVVGTLTMILIPFLLYYSGHDKGLWLYYLNALCHIITLTFVKYTGHYRTPNIISATVAYFIIYSWIESTGMIYSVNICFIHIFVFAAILVDHKWGWTTIFSNIVFLVLVYYGSVNNPDINNEVSTLGSPLYALLLHGIITSFLGSFLAYSLYNIEVSRKKIVLLQDQQINLLDEAVRQRTEQLNNMRQTIAADFHDQTGNMLAAINRQTSVLQIKLKDTELLPILNSIINNSNGLYASSKDFLWNLNNDSDNPEILFQYLASYGQNFYNQFDISFSAEIMCSVNRLQQLNPFASLNLIYIFKEAMSNIVKHSGANEVVLKMEIANNRLTCEIADNGTWKEKDSEAQHYGLRNMERRSLQAGFSYELVHMLQGTKIIIALPLSTYNIEKK